MRNCILRFRYDETAATAIEYSIIAAAMAVAIIAGFGPLADALSARIEFVSGLLDR